MFLGNFFKWKSEVIVFFSKVEVLRVGLGFVFIWDLVFRRGFGRACDSFVWGGEVNYIGFNVVCEVGIFWVG